MTTPRRYPIRLHITTAFTLLLSVVGGSMIWLAYQRNTAMLESSTTELVQRAAHESALALEGVLAPARTGVSMLAADDRLSQEGLSAHFQALPRYVEALRGTPAVVAYYVGDPQGNYFLARRLLDEADRQVFDAPPGTAYLVQSIDRQADPIRSRYTFYDPALHEIGQRDVPHGLDFDPRQRPWFQLARSHDGVVLTPPYVFFTSQKLGLSIARQGGANVFGADVRLDTLNEQLLRLRMTPGAHLFIMDTQKRLLASDTPTHALPATQQALFDHLTMIKPNMAGQAQLQQVTLSGRTWHLETLLLPLADDGSTLLGVAVPGDEMLADARRIGQHMLLLGLTLLLAAFPAAIWLARRISRPLSILVKDTEAIRQFDLDSPIQVESFILEVDELATTLRHTKTTLARFLDIVARLGNEPDFNRLMPELLRATTETAQTDGGLLFLLSEGSGPARPMAGLWDGHRLALGQIQAQADAFSCQAALDQAKPMAGLTDPGDCARFGLDASHCVSLPLFTRSQQPVGVLVLLSRQAMDPARIRFMDALSGFAAVALETRELIAMQRALFESFIQMMAAAIDAKSPYTGGHCARVPEAVKFLAEAACAEQKGPYADFDMSPEQWEALHIAAWLHDCGKVTTPEFVVDKATKLETLYDRIHEIRMRFEVLKRDAEISHLHALAAGADPDTARTERDALLRQLDDEFAFVAECNLGGEFMAPDRVERLRAIAARTWLRTLDDRLGISAEERRRMEGTPAQALPVKEALLSDRPEHRFERPEGEKYGTGNPWGFNMKVPELLYDRGELKNLSIPRGTLSDEERFKINEHIIQTIIMLSALPFPRHLAQVPEIAGGHHERMDGQGYPKGLAGKEMSPLARMMAIADVFEALTAADRPYKSAKTLSQSLGIMGRMAKEGHIDADLYDIFLRSGACLRYAQRFLAADQIDVTDLTAFLPDSGGQPSP